MEESTRGFVIQNGTLIRAAIKKPEICVPSGVKYIGANAFANHHNLQSILLPPGVKSIENSAFYKCENLKEILLPEGLWKIESMAFYGCTSLTSVTLRTGLKKIGYAAFWGCSRLEEILFPETLQSIGAEAFFGCVKLLRFTLLPGVQSIGEKAFYGCSGIRSLTLPAGEISIGANAFARCSSLKELHLPETLTEIGKYGFLSCRGLYDTNGMLIVNGRLAGYEGKSNEIVLNENIKYIAPGIFDKKMHLIMPLKCPSWGQTGQDPSSPAAEPLLSADESVISFTDENGTVAAKVILSFSGESYARQNEARSAIREVGGQFDFECYDRLFTALKEPCNKIRMALVRLELPYALSPEAEKRYLSYLKKQFSVAAELLIKQGDIQRIAWLCKTVSPSEKTVLDLIETVQSLQNPELAALLLDYQLSRFGGASGGMLSLRLGQPAAFPEKPAAVSPWVIRSGSPGLLDRYRGGETDVVFPARLGSVQIKGLADVDFAVPEHYKELRSVVLPEGYQSIGAFAFYGCEALERIELPASLETVGQGAFMNCRALKQLYIRSGVHFTGYTPFFGAKIGTLIFETNDRKLIPNHLFSGCEIDRLVIYGGRFISIGNVFEWTYSYPTTVYCSGAFETADKDRPGFRANCKILPLTDFDESTLDSPLLRALLGMEKRKMKQ